MDRDRDVRWQKRREDFFLRGESVHSPFSIQSTASAVVNNRIKADLSQSSSTPFQNEGKTTSTSRRRPNIPLLQFSLLAAPFPPLTLQQQQQNQGYNNPVLPKLFDGGKKAVGPSQNTRPW